jgi:hypothetical protein
MPNVPDFRFLDRQQRAATDAFSYKNLVQRTGQAGSVATAEQGPIQPEYTATVRQTYPNAVLAESFGSRCTSFIQTLCGYAPNDVVSAACICSDDKNAPIFPGNTFGQYPKSLQRFSGPFFAGGIGGYPFTGIVGTFAWSSHITDTGALFYYIQPHIGITADGQVGFMMRQGQTSRSATCGAANAAQQRVATQPNTPPTFGTGEEFSENDFQQYTLVNTLYTYNGGDVRELLSNNYIEYEDSASDPNPLGYGVRMKLATDTIRDAAAEVFKDTILPAAYDAFFDGDNSRDVFVSVGTFINVDDGYKGYVDVTSFEKYNPVDQSYINYTSQFNAGL